MPAATAHGEASAPGHPQRPQQPKLWGAGRGRGLAVNGNPPSPAGQQLQGLRNTAQSNCLGLVQLMELLSQLEKMDREVETFSGVGEAYRGLEERLMLLLCAVDGVEVGRQQTLRDLQKHANASITKSIRELERKAGVTAEESTFRGLEGAAFAEMFRGSRRSDLLDLASLEWQDDKQKEDDPPLESVTNQLLPLVTRGAAGEFVLQKAALRHVVCRPEVRHCVLAIVCVVGPPRSGKSLLLGLMRDYLAAKAEGHQDWFGVKKELPSNIQETRLDEVFVQVWSEPFLVGDRLAVILLESVDDKLTFALTTLISSVQVINITAQSDWAETDMLQYVNDYAGIMMEHTNDKELQNCLLLMLDDDPNIPQGYQGGATHLTQWMDQAGFYPKIKNLLPMLLTHYKQFTCWSLKSYFGHDLENENNLAGFQGGARSMVERVLRQNHLAPKRLAGHRELRAHELPDLLACVLHELQKPHRSPANLLTAMAHLEHSRVQRAALGVYQRQVLNQLATAKDPAELHFSVIAGLMELFDQTRTLGDHQVIGEYRDRLLKKLECNFEREIAPCLAARESERLKAVTQAFEVSMASFNHTLRNKGTWDVSRSLQDVSNELHEHVVEKLNETKMKMEAECEELLPEYEAWREEEVKNQVSYAAEVEKKPHMPEEKQIYQRALQIYQQEMAQADLETTNLKSHHSQASLNAVSELKTLAKGDGSLLKLQTEKLMKEMQREYAKLKCSRDDQLKLQRKTHKDVLKDLSHTMVEQYKHEVAGMMGDLGDLDRPPAPREQFLAMLETAQLKALQIDPKMEQIGGNKLCKRQIKAAKEEINSLKAEYQTQWEKRVHDTLQEAVDQAVKSFLTQTVLLDWDADCPEDCSPESLAEKQKTECSRALQALHKHAKDYGTDICNSYITSAAEAMNMMDTQQFVAMMEVLSEVTVVDEAVRKLEMALKQLEPASTTRAALDKHYASARAAALDHIRQNLDGSPQLERELLQAEERMQTVLANVTARLVEANVEIFAYEDSLAAYKTQMNELLECVSMPTDSIVRSLHCVAHERALEAYIAKARTGGDDTKLNTFLKKLEEDMFTMFENFSTELAMKHRDDRMAQDNTKNYAIGIDLGTTFSCASVYKDGVVVPIMNKNKKHTTPSVVYFGQHGVLVGEEAKFKGFEDPENCVSEVKRIIGHRFDNPDAQFAVMQLRGCNVIAIDESNTPYIQVTNGDKNFYLPEEVSALLLKELKHQAEVQLGSAVHDAVVTIPAYFTEPQRDATLRACKEAGLNVLRLLNEPTAAAMAYGLQILSEEEKEHKKKNACHCVLVFDFGGGTCDVSILELRGSDFVVKASQGDNQLGGEDYDNRLTEYLIDQLQERIPGLKLDTKNYRRLRYMAEIAKCRLTDSQEFHIHLTNFPRMGEQLDATVEQHTFERITADLSSRALMPVSKCLREAGLNENDIEVVVLAGGSSRIPEIKQRLRSLFPRIPLYDKINPDEAIARGAALQAALLTGECRHAIMVTDITPYSLGIAVAGNVPGSFRYGTFIRKNSRIPCCIRNRYHTAIHWQTAVIISVFQGENPDVFQNTKLGEFVLGNLTPALATVTKVDVTFEIDKNGILSVKAREVTMPHQRKNQRCITITKRVDM